MKKFVAKVAAATVALTMVIPGVAHADRWTKVNAAQCKAAFAAVESGGELPDPSLFRIENNAMVGDTLEIYIGDTKFEDAVDQAIQAWTDASGGDIKIVKVDAPTENSVEIRDDFLARNGEMRWKPNPHIVMNKNFRKAPLESRAFIVAHELGHAMGLSHGCENTVMLEGAGRGTPSLTPTAVDVAAVRQGLF